MQAKVVVDAHVTVATLEGALAVIRRPLLCIGENLVRGLKPQEGRVRVLLLALVRVQQPRELPKARFHLDVRSSTRRAS